ncbi:CAF17-like 4Fe-4S cluster assembly/insertion protein YgfZ [Methylobacterium sp. JK268]
MPIALLPDRAVLAVSGDDATGFLQGLLTCNVETLPPGEARLGALLTPQGKILFDFLVSRAEGGFHLDAPRALLPDLTRRLTLYRLRAKVAFAEAGLRVLAAWGTEPEGTWLRDGRLPALGWRLHAPEGAEPATDATADYAAHRVALGVPESGPDYALGDAFPHEALMDQLGGVDFRKGCYIGQEVVSRMQHRGTARTRVVPVAYEGEAPAPGTPVTAGAKALGQTGSAAGARGLALLRLDRLADAVEAGEAIAAGGAELRPVKPDFARFEVPGAG